jgi:hypothetical protein
MKLALKYLYLLILFVCLNFPIKFWGNLGGFESSVRGKSLYWVGNTGVARDNVVGHTSLIRAWREKRLEMALIQISVPARENYRVIKGF